MAGEGRRPLAHDRVAHDGRPGHVRGVDVFTVRQGRIAEKLAYVKG